MPRAVAVPEPAGWPKRQLTGSLAKSIGGPGGAEHDREEQRTSRSTSVSDTGRIIGSTGTRRASCSAGSPRKKSMPSGARSSCS